MKEKVEMLTIETEDGQTFEREILFTYEDEATKQKYVFVVEPNEESDEDEIIVLRYFEDGTLEDVVDDAELDKLQEVLDAFLAEHYGEEGEEE